MKLILSEEKIILLAPAFMVLLIFFIPISASLKSVFLVLSLMALFFTPYYRKYLSYTFNTLWARAAVVLFFYVIIASLWSEAPFSLRYNVIDKYSKLIFLPLLAVGFIQPRTRKWVLNTYILVMILTCILAVLKANNLLVLNNIDSGGVFFNHIITGVMVAIAVYFSGLLLFQDGLKRGMRFFYLFMIVLGSYQIFFINTGRSGYLAYSIFISLLMIQKLPLKKAIIGILLFISMLLSAYMLSPVMRIGTNDLINSVKLYRTNQFHTSLGLRIQFHQYAQSLFKEHPFKGIGTGGFSYRYAKDQPIPDWGPKLNEPHSQYWLTLAEQGVIGIILFIFFLSTLFVTALRLKEMKPFLLGLLCCFCVLSFSDTIFCYSTLGFLLILFSALCFGELIEEKYPLNSTLNKY